MAPVLLGPRRHLGKCLPGHGLATYFFIDPWNLQTVVSRQTTQVLFYFLQRPPVWIFVFWNVLQFCINTVQIVRLAVDTSEVQFDEGTASSSLDAALF